MTAAPCPERALTDLESDRLSEDAAANLLDCCVEALSERLRSGVEYGRVWPFTLVVNHGHKYLRTETGIAASGRDPLGMGTRAGPAAAGNTSKREGGCSAVQRPAPERVVGRRWKVSAAADATRAW